MNTKTTWSFSNIVVQNTPQVAHVIGLIFLGMAVIGAALLGFVKMESGYTPPLLTASAAVTVTTVANWFLCLGVTIKTIAMGFGLVDTNTGNPVSPITPPPAA